MRKKVTESKPRARLEEKIWHQVQNTSLGEAL